MKTGVAREMSALGAVGSLRMNPVLFNSHFHFEKLRGICHNNVVVLSFLPLGCFFTW